MEQNKKNKIKALFVIDGNMVKDKREISNGFNLFFSSVAKKLNAKLNSSRPVGNTSSEQNKKDFKHFFNHSSRRGMKYNPAEHVIL